MNGKDFLQAKIVHLNKLKQNSRKKINKKKNYLYGNNVGLEKLKSTEEWKAYPTEKNSSWHQSPSKM